MNKSGALIFVLVFMSLMTVTQPARAVSAPPPTQWSKIYAGIEGTTVVQTADGGYAIAGQSGDSFQQGYTNVTDVIVKTDSTGNMQWNKTFKNNPDPNVLLLNAADGGYALAEGQIVSLRTGERFVKTDANGNQQWDRTYQEPGYYAQVRQMIQTSDGGYALAGSVWGDQWTSGKGNKAWVVKIDSTGNVQWQRSYDNFSGFGAPVAFYAESIAQTLDAGYAFACGTNASASLLVKIDGQGNVQWEKKYEGSFGIFSIVKANDDGYVLAGGNNLRAIVVKFDSLGNVQWNKTYDNVEVFVSATPSSGGGYVFAGTANLERESWLVKTDFQGNVEWNATYYGLGQGGVSSLMQTRDGGYAFSGWTGLSNSSTRNIWLVKLAPESPSPTQSSSPTPTLSPSPSPSPSPIPSFKPSPTPNLTSPPTPSSSQSPPLSTSSTSPSTTLTPSPSTPFSASTLTLIGIGVVAVVVVLAVAFLVYRKKAK